MAVAKDEARERRREGPEDRGGEDECPAACAVDSVFAG